ncbi:helix-turn-helix transcriptional regulator [Romboutsia lituseburensis]|uniref:Predicted DNA-binding transcriptional regulator YafY, contains an HTH and WYL domains n=1 Tax=Romboutsia lituseburensis DSM 797 TaxID=1121325 RepID=A0A1G9K986_9FIRM|nr:YafY family protein [Romboutsia lituseburensis]CEH34807.1 HTH domain protein [Romboutsia lituseburensis]SDL45984.1 Predicted DNA-binding transcriptional regulator YafY, contains an HTH and WYL domains [Romboutsia lituseburensis DSM 797]
MKINRLTEIIVTLLNKDTVTAKELADKFSVSTRTIYRDIEELSLSNIPVYMTKGKNGGISLLEEYSVNKAILSAKDKQSLIVALKMLEATNYPEINSVINKIGFMLNKEELSNWIDIDFSRWGSDFNENDKFNQIKMAILNNKAIEFSYINSYGNYSARIIEPMKLMYKGQTWYLHGFCRLKKEARIFRITRIKNLVIKNENFIRRNIKDINTIPSKQMIENMVNLKLKLRKDVLYRIFDDFDQDKVIDNKDGTYDVSIKFPENEWLYGYILSFGNSVEVIEPKYIRDIILNKMKETIKLYELKL